MENFTSFVCDLNIVNESYRLAVGTVFENILPFKDGLLKKEKPCLMAGLDYDTPWTRDTAINVWNAMALLSPEVSKNTLLSVLIKENGGIRIGGQYWDAIIWTIGAYHYYKVTLDEEFFDVMFEAIKNSLKYFEDTEFDKEKNLFRGAAVYGDGVAAYPDKYTNENKDPRVWAWQDNHPKERFPVGFGLPMFALSTNCVYYEAYRIFAEICKIANKPYADYEKKADDLKKAINVNFWNEKKGSFDYLAGECDYQEGLGISFLLLFDIADNIKKNKIFENINITPNGIACVYPSFKRYLNYGGFGRHSGTVWPHVQGFFALAALSEGKTQYFENEFFWLTEKAVRDMQFSEIYHPLTGEIYGGLQEETSCYKQFLLWSSARCQTWSATAYLAMIYYGICGLNFTGNKLVIKPFLPHKMNKVVLKNLKFGNKILNLEIFRNKDYPFESEININSSKETINLKLSVKQDF